MRAVGRGKAGSPLESRSIRRSCRRPTRNTPPLSKIARERRGRRRQRCSRRQTRRAIAEIASIRTLQSKLDVGGRRLVLRGGQNRAPVDPPCKSVRRTLALCSTGGRYPANLRKHAMSWAVSSPPPRHTLLEPRPTLFRPNRAADRHAKAIPCKEWRKMGSCATHYAGSAWRRQTALQPELCRRPPPTHFSPGAPQAQLSRAHQLKRIPDLRWKFQCTKIELRGRWKAIQGVSARRCAVRTQASPTTPSMSENDVLNVTNLAL